MAMELTITDAKGNVIETLEKLAASSQLFAVSPQPEPQDILILRLRFFGLMTRKWEHEGCYWSAPPLPAVKNGPQK